jgi:hypothetical protein
MRRTIILIGCGLGLAFPAAAARGAGGPVGAIQGGTGVGMPGLAHRYVTLPARGGTVVERTTDSGAVSSWRWVPGRYGVAPVGIDDSRTGLAADGRTLVLAGTARGYPPRRTRLLVLDARRLHVRDRIALPGWFTLDAISPHGRWLYLIHYTHGQDTLRYEVRAYDLAAKRLIRRPVVDPREPDEAMRGVAVTRTVSPGGRWAYTLYERPGGVPFVHALDTRRRTAACVDLPALRDGDASVLRLRLVRGGTLAVETSAGPQALIDTRTFAVTRPEAPRPRPARAAAPAGHGGEAWWAALPLAGFAVIALITRHRAGRRPRTPRPA